VLTVLESACVPIPSEVTLGLGGALASGALTGSQGRLGVVGVILAAVAGSLVGSLLAYAIGRTGGRAFVERWGRFVLLKPEDLLHLEGWFTGAGEWSVLYGRMVPFVRTFISLPAGMARMGVAKFVALTAVGVTAWCVLLVSIGYALGGSWHAMASVMGVAGAIAAGGFVVVAAAFLWHRFWLRRRREARRHGEATASTTELPGATAAPGVPPAAQRAHDDAVDRGEDTYLDPLTGYFVFTAAALAANGRCCGRGCRHCPYDAAEQRRAGRPGSR